MADRAREVLRQAEAQAQVERAAGSDQPEHGILRERAPFFEHPVHHVLHGVIVAEGDEVARAVTERPSSDQGCIATTLGGHDGVLEVPLLQ